MPPLAPLALCSARSQCAIRVRDRSLSRFSFRLCGGLVPKTGRRSPTPEADSEASDLRHQRPRRRDRVRVLYSGAMWGLGVEGWGLGVGMDVVAMRAEMWGLGGWGLAMGFGDLIHL